MAEERARPSRRPKYQAIGDWLVTQPATRVTLSFGGAERLLGHRLPQSAWYGFWWRSAVREGLWHAPGWRWEAVDHRHRLVTFVRGDATSEPPP